ncbi:hypothetical protein [Flavobacterium sp. JP2137]|uniref:hypothetical protein n=1 Tax=Flavobacterium sp. JP2137 TaxID=3414510 RepID=UPI003D2FD296
MKKRNSLVFFLALLSVVFIAACSSSDDNGGGDLGPKGSCGSPARHIAATYQGFVNEKAAQLQLNATKGDRVVATLTYTDKKGEEFSRVAEFDVETNLYCEEMGLDYITQIDASESGRDYAVLFKYKERNTFIEFFTLESLTGEYGTIFFENGRK